MLGSSRHRERAEARADLRGESDALSSPPESVAAGTIEAEIAEPTASRKIDALATSSRGAGDFFLAFM